MGPEDGGRVERPVVVRAERVLPEGGEQERADHAEDDVIDIHRTELALLDAAAQNGRDQVDSTVGDRVEIEASQLGEVAGLGDDQLGDHARGRGDDGLPGRQQPLEQDRGGDGLGEQRLELARGSGATSPRTTALKRSSLLG